MLSGLEATKDCIFATTKSRSQIRKKCDGCGSTEREERSDCGEIFVENDIGTMFKWLVIQVEFNKQIVTEVQPIIIA